MTMVTMTKIPDCDWLNRVIRRLELSQIERGTIKVMALTVAFSHIYICEKNIYLYRPVQATVVVLQGRVRGEYSVGCNL